MTNGFGFNMETFSFFGIVLFGVAYAVSQFRSGSTKASAELVSTLTAQLKAQKEINDSLQNQINHLTSEVGRLNGINEANDQKIKEYLQIIANRSPELEETLTLIEQSVQDFVPFMEDMRQWHQSVAHTNEPAPQKSRRKKGG